MASNEGKKISLSMSLQPAKKSKKPILTSVIGLKSDKEAKENNVDFITTIDENTKTIEPPSLVIPLTKNAWITSKEDAAAVEAILNETSNNNKNDSENKEIKSIKPILQSNMIPGLMNIENEDDRFKHDVSLRANNIDVKSECYVDTKIEDFGAALLRGMGWKGSLSDESEPNKQPRPGRLGLGAQVRPPSPPSLSKNKIKKPGQKDSINHIKQNDHWKKEAEKKIKDQNLKIGDIVWLRDSRYIKSDSVTRAYISKLTGIPGLNRIEVILEGETYEMTTVLKTDAILIEESELKTRPFIYNNQHQNKPEKNNIKSENNNKDKKRSLSSHEQNKNELDKNDNDDSSKTSKRSKTSSLSWVIKGCKVRVVSNKNPYHKQKGIVINIDKDDKNDKERISLKMDSDGEIIKHLKEYELETVIPSIGDMVMVVKGSYRKYKAEILKKDRDKEEIQIRINGHREYFSFDDVTAIAK
mmetsp:Transcript_89/g.96  ORF Transcript_89/g.96 Transcript_89/m.96 type:complete len:471 (+) Transcript_89:144-1556(+)